MTVTPVTPKTGVTTESACRWVQDGATMRQETTIEREIYQNNGKILLTHIYEQAMEPQILPSPPQNAIYFISILEEVSQLPSNIHDCAQQPYPAPS